MINGTTEISNKEAALQYAEAGFPVFPCHFIRDGKCSCGIANCASPGKHPLPKDGLNAATTGQEKIKQWWTANPEANVAIRTGEQSGCWALDLDGIKGIRDFTQIEENHPDRRESPRSPRGAHC